MRVVRARLDLGIEGVVSLVDHVRSENAGVYAEQTPEGFGVSFPPSIGQESQGIKL